MGRQTCELVVELSRYLMLTRRSYNYDPSALYNDDAYPVGRFSNEFGFHSSEYPRSLPGLVDLV
jgi:hypothetical protein